MENTAPDGTGTAYAEGAGYSDSADLTLSAEWTPRYQIGDTGPVEGIVFCGKGSYLDYWRYIEA